MNVPLKSFRYVFGTAIPWTIVLIIAVAGLVVILSETAEDKVKPADVLEEVRTLRQDMTIWRRDLKRNNPDLILPPLPGEEDDRS